MTIVEVGVDFAFEAAHWLRLVPEDHKCRRLHGHSYRVTVAVAGPVRDDGMVIDYADIKRVVRPCIELLDHQLVNDIVPNSTAENLAIWLWDSLTGDLPLAAVTVHETATTHCTYRGPS